MCCVYKINTTILNSNMLHACGYKINTTTVTNIDLKHVVDVMYVGLNGRTINFKCSFLEEMIKKYC